MSSIKRYFFTSFRWVGVLLVLWQLAVPAAAAPKRVALLIGNSAYLHEEPLRNPVNDIQLIANTLRGMGFDGKHIVVKPNLKRREMDRVIRQFARDSAGADTALFYYAGHGQQLSKGGRNFLLPIDAKPDDDDALQSDAIAADSVAELLEGRPQRARLRLVILDACRQSRTDTRGPNRGLSPPPETDSYTLTAYATKANAVAKDGIGANSPYALALAKHLPQTGNTSVRLVFEAVAQEVRSTTRQQQSPTLYGDLETGVTLDGVRVAVTQHPLTSGSASPPGVQPQAQSTTEAGSWYKRFLHFVGISEPQKTYVLKHVIPPQKVQSSAVPALVPSGTTLPPPKSVKACQICPEMVIVPAGNFMMGSPDSEPERQNDEGPWHRVSVRKFELGKHEVTQSQWMAVMGSNPSGFAKCGGDCPVERVSWYDVKQFIRTLNEETGKTYRLPSEAEWEYAARAGTKDPWGRNGTDLKDTAWYNSNSEGRTHPVCQKQANAFGLCDMLGNVQEWVQDAWHSDYNVAPTDGSAWESGGDSTERVLRGGNIDSDWKNLRAARRNEFIHDFHLLRGKEGFRLARTVP